MHNLGIHVGAAAADVKYITQCAYIRNETAANLWNFKFIVVRNLGLIKQVYTCTVV